jgi:hypothetical protein
MGRVTQTALPLTCPVLSFTEAYDKLLLPQVRCEPGWGSAGKFENRLLGPTNLFPCVYAALTPGANPNPSSLFAQETTRSRRYYN